MRYLILLLFFVIFLTGCEPITTRKDIAYKEKLEQLEKKVDHLENVVAEMHHELWNLKSDQYVTMHRMNDMDAPVEEATVFYMPETQDTAAELLEDSTRLSDLETKEKLSKKEQREKMQLDYEQKERRLDQQLDILTKQNQQIDSLLKK